MKCNECQEALSAYYDHKLNEEEYKAVQVHLKECKACEAEYRLFVQMIESLKDNKKTIVPANIHEKMLSKVKAEGSKKNIINIWIKRMEVIAAALLIGVMWYGIDPLKLHIPKETTESVEDAATTNLQSRSLQQPEMAAYMEDEMEAAISDEIENVEIQIWQIETDELFTLEEYLKGYASENNLILESSKENEISFILYDVKQAETLFDTLTVQDFTRNLIRITNTGKNIKIILKA